MPGVESRFGQFMFWLRSKGATFFRVPVDAQFGMRRDLLRLQGIFRRAPDLNSSTWAKDTLASMDVLCQTAAAYHGTNKTLPRAFYDLVQSPYLLSAVLAHTDLKASRFNVTGQELHTKYLSLVAYACNQDVLSPTEALELLLGHAGYAPGVNVRSYLHFLMSHPSVSTDVVCAFQEAVLAAFQADLRHDSRHSAGRLVWTQALLRERGYGDSGELSAIEALCEGELARTACPLLLDAFVVVGLMPNAIIVESVLQGDQAQRLVCDLQDKVLRPRLRTLSGSSVSSWSDFSGTTAVSTTSASSKRSTVSSPADRCAPITGIPLTRSRSAEDFNVSLRLDLMRRKTPPGSPVLKPPRPSSSDWVESAANDADHLYEEPRLFDPFDDMDPGGYRGPGISPGTEDDEISSLLFRSPMVFGLAMAGAGAGRSGSGSQRRSSDPGMPCERNESMASNSNESQMTRSDRRSRRASDSSVRADTAKRLRHALDARGGRRVPAWLSER